MSRDLVDRDGSSGSIHRLGASVIALDHVPFDVGVLRPTLRRRGPPTNPSQRRSNDLAPLRGELPNRHAHEGLAVVLIDRQIPERPDDGKAAPARAFR